MPWNELRPRMGTFLYLLLILSNSNLVLRHGILCQKIIFETSYKICALYDLKTSKIILRRCLYVRIFCTSLSIKSVWKSTFRQILGGLIFQNFWEHAKSYPCPASANCALHWKGQIICTTSHYLNHAQEIIFQFLAENKAMVNKGRLINRFCYRKRFFF